MEKKRKDGGKKYKIHNPYLGGGKSNSKINIPSLLFDFIKLLKSIIL